MIIVGAGMAGLLAGLMLRRHSPTIHEAQSALPNNHTALLRFRTAAVSEATGIPFTSVHVRKAVYRVRDGLRAVASLADSNEYALKVSGEAADRSILDLSPGERFIAPVDFIEQMSRGLRIEYGSPFRFTTATLGKDAPPVVSTVPMPKMMDEVAWPGKPQFFWRPIWTVTGWIDLPPTNLYQTLYYPDLEWPWYRASITGNRLTIEYVEAPDPEMVGFQLSLLLSHFGVNNATVRNGGTVRQEYGKLVPLKDNETRKEFIMALTDQYNIWSLGRFATWRQIVLDDVVKDIQFVDRVVSARDQYARRLHHHNTV